MKHILVTLIAACGCTLHAQTIGQFGIPKWTASGTQTQWITPQNSKVFGINSSGALEMVTGGGSSTLGALSDVALASLTSGQLLQYNGTGWVNWTPTYAPTNSPTFTGTVTIPSGASIAGYLTSATASSTYQMLGTSSPRGAGAGALFMNSGADDDVAEVPGGSGGTINVRGGNADGSAGGTAGSLLTHGSSHFNGGTLTLNANDTNDAGNINTQAGGSLTMGTGNLAGGDVSGTILTTQGDGSGLTTLNASNLTAGTVNAARMPALTGDVTTSAGSVATSIATGAVGATQLASTAVTPGTYTNMTGTVDADGRLTAASSGSSGITIGTTTINGTAGRVLYTDGTNVQAYDKTGSGSTVVMSGGPTFAGPVTISGNGTYLYFSGVGSYMQLGGSAAPGFFGVTRAYEIKNGTQNVSLRVYNTETSSTNYERATMSWSANVLSIGTQKGSGGGTARDMVLITDDIERARISSAGITIASGLDLKLGNTAVAETPTATHTLIIKDAAGVSYRVLAVPVP